MKKVLISLLTIVFVVSLSSCLKKEAEAPAPAPAAPTGGLIVTDNLSLMGWLKKGKGVECTISDPEGTVTMRSIGDKVRIDGITYANMETGQTSESGSSITANGWMYMWAGTEGTKMNLKRLEEIGKDMATDEGSAEEQETWEDMVGNWEEGKVDYRCKDVRLSDNIFTPPVNVNFVDFTAMLEGVAEFGKNLEEQINEGGEFDLDALEAEAEKLKEQYGIE